GAGSGGAGGKGARPARTEAPTPLPDAALNTQALLDVANGSYADARKTLAKALEQHPDNPVTLFNLGLCDFHLGDHAEALRNFTRARQVLAAGARNLERQAGPGLRLRHPAAATASADIPPGREEDALRALVKVWALQADAITYQGHAQAALGKAADARRLFREALPTLRKQAAAQTALGDLQRAGGDRAAAIASYTEAARTDARYPAPWLALHELAAEQRQPVLAKRYRGIYDRLSSRERS
ncbi:MAG: tetratricopeptide repeat protein, partial [Candidatus Sericytochromatia bacterium]|nr:tetratricopeptide repeat protein [Candidatus Tanganyikabacteria bacterium]